MWYLVDSVGYVFLYVYVYVYIHKYMECIGAYV